MAVGSLDRADEGTLLGPSLPFAVLDLVGVFFRRLIVPEPGRFMFQHSGHALRSFEIFCTAICAVITGFRQYAQCSVGSLAPCCSAWHLSRAPEGLRSNATGSRKG